MTRAGRYLIAAATAVTSGILADADLYGTAFALLVIAIFVFLNAYMERGETGVVSFSSTIGSETHSWSSETGTLHPDCPKCDALLGAHV